VKIIGGLGSGRSETILETRLCLVPLSNLFFLKLSQSRTCSWDCLLFPSAAARSSGGYSLLLVLLCLREIDAHEGLENNCVEAQS
jgi:hypothetical protein